MLNFTEFLGKTFYGQQGRFSNIDIAFREIKKQNPQNPLNPRNP